MIAITTKSSMSVKPIRFADLAMEPSFSHYIIRNMSCAGTKSDTMGTRIGDLGEFSPQFAVCKFRRITRSR